ncbi:adenine deaminase C-terminal domain-containing protein [Natrinema longum]|uniref:adenine deaminase n=1 Tax=Natrinema longum TaxID=370324 RepID=A0A8A2U971_9EURY|nr:adenine deaminase C-terminal domain-containing protein [Natrinema longum]MBZ6493437.1 amidohydrolase family protein [Natrinema longum]QSW85216.1 adenine deaminase [Natrinema longum]
MNELQPIALESEGATADLVVEGGRVYCSNRREFLERDVAVVGDRIAALPEDAGSVTGPDTTVVSAADRVVLPGLIDAHTHADIQLIFDRAVPELLATGTTAIVTESSGLGLLFGSRGVETFLERTADCPISTYVTLPPQAFVDTFEPATGSPAELEALSSLLERERVVGVGEIDWIHVVGQDAPIERLYERAREKNAAIVGHGAGCRGDSLRAFATVVDNDHEAISAAGIRERAENGIHVVGRCGSIRDDLAALIEAYPALDPGSVSLSTDGVWPGDLLEGVGMAELVRRLIDAGVEPADAIDAATRNTAEQFGLANRGIVAPGAVADLVVVDDLETMAVETVCAEGEVVVADGDPLVEARTDPYPEYVYDTVSVALERERFTAPLEAAPDGTVRAMTADSGLVTTETTVDAGIVDAGDGREPRLGPDPHNDVLTATLLDRDPATDDRGFTGFLTGYGLESGAIATTGTWESPGLVTVAADTDDAVVAADRVASMGGGFAVARDGEVVADLAMPIAATAAELAPETFATEFDLLEDALREGGVDIDRPLLTVQTLTFPGVPAVKLTPSGYANVRGRSVVGLEPDPARPD